MNTLSLLKKKQENGMKDYSILIYEFYNLVSNFYSKKYGIFPIASEAIIQLSVNNYLEKTPLREIKFDSPIEYNPGTVVIRL